MGSVCSTKSVQIKNGKSPGRDIVAALLLPIRLSRDDAEKLLVAAQCGSYVFSYDITSDCFVSVSAGDYVCHHAIARQDSFCIVGGECFQNINEAIQHYKNHPLGPVKLTNPFNSGSIQRNKSVLKKETSLVKKRSLIRNAVTPINGTEASLLESWKKQRKVSFKSPSPCPSPYSVENVNEEDSEKHKAGERKTQDQIPTMFTSISVSSDEFEEEKKLEEQPIPVLPAPSGTRPPPLFPRFSNLAEEIAEFPLDSDRAFDIKRTLFQLYKGNPRLKYTPRVNVIKIIVVGEVDTIQERRYFASHMHKQLKEFTDRRSIFCEYIDRMLTSQGTSQNNIWWDEEMFTAVAEEITFCVKNDIPYMLLIYTGHRIGPLLIPRSISEQDFDWMLQQVEYIEDVERLRNIYVKDENQANPTLVLRRSVLDNNTDKLYLHKLFAKSESLLKDERIWNLISPAAERHIKEALSSNNGHVILVERKFYDLDEHSHNQKLLAYKLIPENQILNDFLNTKFSATIKCLRKSMPFIEQEQEVITNSSVTVFLNDEKLERSCANISRMVMDRIQTSISKIQTKLNSRTINDIDYDEVLYHIMASKRLSDESTVDETVLQEVKIYIQGTSTKPMFICGTKDSGKTSVISRVSAIACDWFNDSCCVVCRFIGHTFESSSLQLMLRGVCLQISYAYSTDPNAVPQDLEGLIEFFPLLLDLPTDSLPLVLVFDSLDEICFNKNMNSLSIIPVKLHPHVKVIASVSYERKSEIMSLFQEEHVIKATLSSFTAYRALEYLDYLLVKQDKTLNEQQKLVVESAIDKNYDPVFVRFVLDEIVQWNSSNSCEIPFIDSSDGVNSIRKKVIDKFGEKFYEAFSFGLSLQQFGIPLEVLVNYLKPFIETKDEMEIQECVSSSIKQMKNICTCKIISGHIFVQWRCNKMNIYLGNNAITKNSDIIYSLKNSTQKLLLEKLNTTNLTDTQKLDKINRSQILFSYLLRISLRFDSCLTLKKNLLFNFTYLSARLSSLSLSHLLYDLETALSSYPDDVELNIMQQFFHLSKGILGNDPEQFPLQAFCRFGPPKNFQLDKLANSCLYQFLEDVKKRCEVVMPCRQCLTMPLFYCKLSQKKQCDWSVKDLKIVFLHSQNYEFVCWSSEREELYFHNKEKCLEKVKFIRHLHRVVLAVGEKLLIEVRTPSESSRLDMYNVDTDVWENLRLEDADTNQPSCFSDFNIFATDHEKLIISLNEKMDTLTITDLDTLEVVWRFENDVAFHNVIVCKNASMAVCFNDRAIVGENFSVTGNEQRYENGGQNFLEDILILDLKEKQQTVCLKTPPDQYFGKVLAISDDGRYFVRCTEMGIHVLIWDLTKGKLMHHIDTKSCRIVKILVSTEGDCVVFVSSDSTLWVYHLLSGKLKYKLKEQIQASRGGYMDNAHSLCLSDDGSIITLAVKSNSRSSFLVVFDLKTGTRLASLTTDFRGLNYQLSSKGDYIVSNFPVGLVVFDINKNGRKKAELAIQTV